MYNCCCAAVTTTVAVVAAVVGAVVLVFAVVTVAAAAVAVAVAAVVVAIAAFSAGKNERQRPRGRRDVTVCSGSGCNRGSRGMRGDPCALLTKWGGAPGLQRLRTCWNLLIFFLKSRFLGDILYIEPINHSSSVI